MATETKILFENIKTFRNLLTEGVGQDSIVDAIQNHEWVYIYYNANNEEGKNASGYRTIRPYVLGTNASGHQVLRAWQDNPKNSWHFAHKPTRPKDNPNDKESKFHDYWTDAEGEKPGWRMFRLDRISKLYPIGKKFEDRNGKVMIPAGYREGSDDDMTSITAYVSTNTKSEVPTQVDKEYTGTTMTRSEINKAKWDSIRGGNKNNKKITSNDVVKLRDLASRVQKTSIGSYLVVIDDKNNFQIILAKDKDKQQIPDTAIVGSLPHLYDTLVKANAPADNRFFNDVKNKTRNIKQSTANQQTEIKETELPTIPFEKKTFFKN